MTPTYLQASSCHCLRASPLCHRLYVGNLAHKNRTMMLAFGPCFKQGRHRRDGKYQQLRDDNAPLAECVTEHKPSQHSSRSQTSLSNRHLNMLYSANTSSQPMQLRLENILRERNYKTISELFVASYTTLCNQGLQSHVRLVMCSCKVSVNLLVLAMTNPSKNPTACVCPLKCLRDKHSVTARRLDASKRKGWMKVV